jgi:hypothetical protein
MSFKPQLRGNEPPMRLHGTMEVLHWLTDTGEIFGTSQAISGECAQLEILDKETFLSSVSCVKRSRHRICS